MYDLWLYCLKTQQLLQQAKLPHHVQESGSTDPQECIEIPSIEGWYQMIETHQVYNNCICKPLFTLFEKNQSLNQFNT